MTCYGEYVPSPVESTVVIRPLTEEDRAEIARWHYGGELSIYDPGVGATELRAPDHVAFAAPDEGLIGYGTLGAEARVRGGDYRDTTKIVDLGIGLRPVLVGKGRGAEALRVLIAYAEQQHASGRCRATVASANGRATALVVRLGFRPTHRFERPGDGRAFVQYERDAKRFPPRR